MAATNTIQITVGELAFHFTSKQHWINKGHDWYARHGLIDGRAISIDAKGRICKTGLEFRRAEEENAYPINVYRAVI